ncbi:serine carboxypeptidase-like 34 [Iris pallida]|uniref:Serine carboxypeptidase-like 34 n=1 Tax=Iris pallida TaxID=29817 RepID=A0AAX6FPV0_IRIPA|nr:serine carboxypeptidase-like 34 [Iris pallida]
MVGNAVMNDETDQKGMVDYAWDRRGDLRRGLRRYQEELLLQQRGGRLCLRHGGWTSTSQSTVSSICYPVRPRVRREQQHLLQQQETRMVSVLHPRFSSKHSEWHQKPAGYDPCVSEHTSAYFNRPDVQSALHANVTGISYPWTHCSNVIEGWNSVSSLLQVIRKLINGGIRVWVFSGDTTGDSGDGDEADTAEAWPCHCSEVETMVQPPQVGGWTVVYDGLTFVTIRGAGHQVPTFTPKQAQQLVRHFLVASSCRPRRFSNGRQLTGRIAPPALAS